jgi:hypothetical protein
MSKAKHKPHQWIDGETADRITALNLRDYRSYLKKELAQWKKNHKTEDNPKGFWLHPEDVSGNIRRIEALNLIINDFIEVPDDTTMSS